MTKRTAVTASAVGALLAAGVGVGVGFVLSEDEQPPEPVESSVEDPAGKKPETLEDEPTETPTPEPEPMHTPEAEPPAVEYEPLPYLADLYNACADGDMIACDDLYYQSPVGSEEERFADTCGDTQPAGSAMVCHMVVPEDPNHPQDMTERVSGFGETYEWDTGLSVTVSEPEEFTPSDTAAYDESEAYVSYDVTVVNNTGSSVDVGEYMSTMLSGGVEGTTVFDDGMEGPAYVTLLPGQDVTFTEGWGVADTGDMTLSVNPGFDYVEWRWTTGQGA